MNGKLTANQKTQLEQWIGERSKSFHLLYRITRDGCDASTFHQKCDNHGPTVTVAYNTSGYIYGGYTSQSWTSANAYVNDDKAFLFSLSNTQKYPVKNTTYSVYCNAGYGPTFGGGPDKSVHHRERYMSKSERLFDDSTHSNAECEPTFGGGSNNSVHCKAGYGRTFGRGSNNSAHCNTGYGRTFGRRSNNSVHCNTGYGRTFGRGPDKSVHHRESYMFKSGRLYDDSTHCNAECEPTFERGSNNSVHYRAVYGSTSEKGYDDPEESYAEYEPTFEGGHDLCFFTNSIQNVRNVFKLNVQTNFGKSYTSHGHSINNLTGGINNLSELEVYAVAGRETDPWRKTPTWDDKLMKSLRDAVENYKPYEGLKPRNVNILMIGPVGSGKSSFYNTISSIFRGRISSQATAGSVEHSLTNQFRKYKVLGEDAGKPTSFRLCDTMGLEEEQGMDSADVPFILDGNVPDRYRFNPASNVTPEIPNFNKSPELNDKIHCVAFVLNSTKVEAMSEKLLLKIQSIRHHISQRAIPIVVLLTKIDQLCSMVLEDVGATFQSADVKNMVDKAAALVGVPRSHVLPVKNYESEIELDVNVNILALFGLRQMLWFADDFLCNQADLLQREESS